MTTTSGVRQVNLSPERLQGWLNGFADRHGQPVVTTQDQTLVLHSPDHAEAYFELRWGALAGLAEPLSEFVAQSLLPRRVGALIVRRRSHAVGIFDGVALIAGRHHSHYVQGRTKAGGWSQQRYARRRANQADRAYASAVTDAVQILANQHRLVALATGGDHAGLATVLSDPRLQTIQALPRIVVPGVPDPNAKVLAGFAQQFRQVSIGLNEFA